MMSLAGGLSMTKSVQTSFLDLGQKRNGKKIMIPRTCVPREGDINRVLDLLGHSLNNSDVCCNDMKIGQTAFDHIVHLARELGIIDESKQLTRRGRGIMQLEYEGRLSRLSLAFEQTKVVQGWKKWSEVDSLIELNSDTCKQFLNSTCPTLTKSTRNVRASVLRRLLRDLAPHHPLRKYSELQDERDPDFNIVSTDPIFGNRVIDTIDRIKHSYGIVRVSTGWMTAKGYNLVTKNLKSVQMKILLGADDTRGRALLENPIDYFNNSINSGPPSDSKRNQHFQLYRDLLSGSRRVKELNPRVLDKLHAKGYFFGLNSGLPTSANMTWNGLIGNVESGLVTADEDDLKYLVKRFEHYFEMGEDITTDLIEIIEDSWIFQEPVKPYLAYLRGLIELYGKIAGQHKSESFELADFQEMIVASTLHSLNESRGALLISPTGTGKTIMGSYIIATECSKPESKVLVFAPNTGVKKKWEKTLMAFNQTHRVWTHRDITYLNSEDSSFREEMEMFVDENTLIVVDEAHRFRSEGNTGETNLRMIAEGRLNNKGRPKLLFLTATPIGVGFQNLQTLHSMLDIDDFAEGINEVPSVAGLVNVTLKFIIHRFGKEDEEGNKHLNYSNKRMYFARRAQTMTFIRRGNEEIYQAISNLHLKRLRENPEFSGAGNSLDQFGIGIEPIPEFLETDNMGFSRLGLARAVSSSKSAAMVSLMKAMDTLDGKNYSDPERTRNDLMNLRNLIESNYDDRKFNTLVNYLKQHPREKALIIVGRIATRDELVERLNRALNKNIVAYVGTEKQKENIREAFAPKAHNIRMPKRKQIDILISTDSVSEGFDLQDANIGIDYDLWWTPLVLQQRMGRLDRPTNYPRSFEVLRFVNQVPEFTELVPIDRYLSERSVLLKKLIADGAYEEDEIRDWVMTEDEDLGIITARTESIDELDLSDFSSTSHHIADLANASDDERVEARELPVGFETSLISEKSEGTFVMFESDGKIRIGYGSLCGKELLHSPGNTPSERVLGKIRSIRDTPIAPLPDNHYDEVSKLIEDVCKAHGLNHENQNLIFSAAVRSSCTELENQE